MSSRPSYTELIGRLDGLGLNSKFGIALEAATALRSQGEALAEVKQDRDEWRSAHAETVATWDESKDNWSLALQAAEARANRLEALVKEAGEALGPFAEYSLWFRDLPSAELVDCGSALLSEEQPPLYIGDFREARQALLSLQKASPSGDDIAVSNGHPEAEQAGDWKPFFFGHEWFAEHYVADLEEVADGLRRKADFIDGKAALLHEQMLLAAHQSESGADVREAEAEQAGGGE